MSYKTNKVASLVFQHVNH